MGELRSASALPRKCTYVSDSTTSRGRNNTQNVSSGTVDLDPINVDAPNDRLSIGASDIAAGDTIQRTGLIKNVGTIDLSGVDLTTTATTSSLLDTDTVQGRGGSPQRRHLHH